jgi:hypothetical protein
MSSEEPNPIYGLTAMEVGRGANLDCIVPGAAGSSELRQSSERPEWSAYALLSYAPSDRWTISLNPRWQGPEWAYAGSTEWGLGRTNPGHGWIMVRSAYLSPNAIASAIKKGDFYNSTGVELKNLEITNDGISLSVDRKRLPTRH